MESKFCVDCKFCKLRWSTFFSAEYGRCTRYPKSVDAVTGDKEFWYCSTARGSTGMCSPEGYWFEPKHGQGFLEWIKSL